MSLSQELISKFAKVTNDDKKTKKESTVYGTVVEVDGKECLHIDGAYDQNGDPIYQPLLTTVVTAKGNRVIVSIRNHMAVVTGNLTTPSVTEEKTVEVIEVKVADKLKATDAEIANLKAKDVEITGTLAAQNAKIEGKIDASVVEADYAKIEEMNVRYGEFQTLQSDYGVFKTTYAEDLEATEASIGELESDTAHINELMFGSAAGKVLQTAFANAVIALLGDAQIKNAMIDSLNANKINAGSINTNKVNLASEDGSLTIFDNLIQIKDGQNVRVQIGKDASGNYSIVICDESGATMLDANGITENAIKEAIIVNDMIADDANISGSKIDIDSLITKINENGSATIKSSKIYFDADKQTLDVKFKELSDDVTAKGTQITALNDKFTSKVWMQDIRVGGKNLLKNSRHILLTSNNSAKYPTTSTLETENGREFYRYIRTSPELTPDTMSLFSTIPVTHITEVLTGKEVTFSFLMRCSHETVMSVMGILMDRTEEENDQGYTQQVFGVTTKTVPIGTAWQRVFITKNISLDYEYVENNLLRFNPNNIQIPDGEIENFYIDVCEWKIELGNVATDWTPAPEDFDADVQQLSTKYSLLEQDVDSITSTVTKHTTQITEAGAELTAVQSTIGQLVDSISMLVTDGNGTSLMTQTEDGWTFSTAGLQNAVDKTSEDLSNLVRQCGNTDAAVEVLQQAVSDLGVLSEYVKIGTLQGEPCIELGEGDSNFKLVITNTRIMFMDGSDIPAYINNKSLYIKKAVIEEELHQGGYAWVTRSNGHLSLVWKGVTN